MTIRTLLLWILVTVPGLAAAADMGAIRQGDIAVAEPWTRAPAGAGGTAGVFLTIRNDGDVPEHLVAVACDAAASSALHTTVADGNIMRMRPVDAIAIPPHQTVTLRPGGLHVMLMGLKEPLEVGRTLTVTLRFERAGSLALPVPVERPGARGPTGGH